MIYQQIPMIRLARSGKKLVQDGQWYPFGDDGRTYYRVQKKIMQRVRLEEGEDTELLSLFEHIGPIPSRTAKGGFREEIHIRVKDDLYVLEGIWLKAYIGWEMLASAAQQHGVKLSFSGANSLEFIHEMDEFTSDAFVRGLLLAKAVSVVGAQLSTDSITGVPHVQAEVAGLLKAAYTVHLEEHESKRSSKRSKKQNPNQSSLFDS